MKALKTGGPPTPRGPGPVGAPNAHSLARSQHNRPCLVPASRQMAHLFRLSARQDAGPPVRHRSPAPAFRASWRARAPATASSVGRSNANLPRRPRHPSSGSLAAVVCLSPDREMKKGKKNQKEAPGPDGVLTRLTVHQHPGLSLAPLHRQGGFS